MGKDWQPLAEVRNNFRVQWYRCPVDPNRLRELMKRSDLQGWFHSIGNLLLVAGTGLTVYFFWSRQIWIGCIISLFVHGTIGSFFRGLATHELNHGTVFRTKWLNRFFLYLYAILSWDNPFDYAVSHTYHHRYTLHPKGDREAVLPAKLAFKFTLMLQLFSLNIWNKRRSLGTGGVLPVLIDFLLTSVGVIDGEWVRATFADQPKERAKSIWWARIVLIFHGSVITLSVIQGQWMLPVIVCLFPFIGNWLTFFVGMPMHSGLRDNITDFRKCVRSITLNPFVEFIYWHMNWHTEHHMYAGVPCYNLKKLYDEIADDMPMPRSLISAWREMRQTWKQQKIDPDYQYDTPIPDSATKKIILTKDELVGSIGELAPKTLE